ncbi:unnamed protein product [Colias eurytheme]|nr:unnamed protein product [Colias eurytheme]
MPRRYQRKTETKYKLEDLEKAVHDVRNKILSLGKASIIYSVPKSTIHDYLKKEIINEPKTGRKAIFTDAQETELEQHIIKCSKVFYGLTIEMVRKIAFKFAEVNQLKHNFDKTSQMAGKDWFYGFKKRHPEISLRKPESTSINRITAFNETEVKMFFNNLEAVQAKYHFDGNRIYNVDETGISNVQRNSRILAPKGQKQVGMATSGERGTTTTVVCAFSASGRYRIDAGDLTLEKHLKNSSNATYISKRIQNEIIELCKEDIQETIINNVKEAKYFAVIFDETTDISATEQLSLSLRYLKNNIIREDFVTFCDAYSDIRKEDVPRSDEPRLTGVALAHIVIDLCTKFGLDLSNCVGIGTDSCSVMASEVKGAVSELSKFATHAQKCPCNNHILNNSLAKSANVPSCRNTAATMKKLVAFTNASAKRSKVFKDVLGGKLGSLCDTRWVERHDGYLQFQGDSLVKICDILSIISTWRDTKSASDASCLRHALCSSDFIIASICLSDLLGATVSLSRFLQKTTLDLKVASDTLKDTVDVLLSKRKNAEEIFHNLFVEAQELAEKLGVVIMRPRTTARQTLRDNYQGDEEEYFRRTIYTYLDLLDRLSADTMNLYGLGIFMPKPEYTENDFDQVKKLSEWYSHFLTAPAATVVTEYQLWSLKWKREYLEKKNVPNCVLTSIEVCDEDLFANKNRRLPFVI